MFKVFTPFLILLCFLFSNLKIVFAIDDGIYTGVFKMTYGHGLSTSKKGDTGIFEFYVKNNKISKIKTPDIQIGFFAKINW